MATGNEAVAFFVGGGAPTKKRRHQNFSGIANQA